MSARLPATDETSAEEWYAYALLCELRGTWAHLVSQNRTEEAKGMRLAMEVAERLYPAGDMRRA